MRDSFSNAATATIISTNYRYLHTPLLLFLLVGCAGLYGNAKDRPIASAELLTYFRSHRGGATRPKEAGVCVGGAVADYVAIALIGHVDDPDSFDGMFATREFQGGWPELRSHAEKRCGFSLSDEIVREAVRTLSKCGLVRVSNDKYAGEFVKLYPDRFDEFKNNAKKELEEAKEDGYGKSIMDRASDYPNASVLESNSVVADYSELGDEWMRRALAGLQKEIEEAGSLSDFLLSAREGTSPASDRIVRFDNNQISKIEEKTDEIINGVEQLNSIGDRAGLRELILGQLKAGRELVRSGCFKLYLLEVTLLDALRNLAIKYEKEAVGALANALIEAILKAVGLKS